MSLPFISRRAQRTLEPQRHRFMEMSDRGPIFLSPPEREPKYASTRWPANDPLALRFDFDQGARLARKGGRSGYRRSGRDRCAITQPNSIRKNRASATPMAAKVASSFRRLRTRRMLAASQKVVAIIRCIALLRNCLGRNADVGRQPLQLLGFPFQALGAAQTPLAIRLQGNHPGDLPKLRSLGALSCNIR